MSKSCLLLYLQITSWQVVKDYVTLCTQLYMRYNCLCLEIPSLTLLPLMWGSLRLANIKRIPLGQTGSPDPLSRGVCTRLDWPISMFIGSRTRHTKKQEYIRCRTAYTQHCVHDTHAIDIVSCFRARVAMIWTRRTVMIAPLKREPKARAHTIYCHLRLTLNA